MNTLGTWKDKALFTPGPLTTSRTIKQAMLRDLGSRDTEFIHIIQDVRDRLLGLCNCDGDGYTAILMQGSGTFGMEAVISSVIPPEGKLLVLINGAYGERILKMAEINHIPTVAQRYPENKIPDLKSLDELLVCDPSISHVAVVHCETTTGIINPIELFGEICQTQKRIYIVDAMSSFGAYPLNFQSSGIDFLVSSANKDIESVPGFSFIIARKDKLMATKGFARTLSLDLYAQWEEMEKNGQFRFTPPVQAILAFHQALLELEAEGGVLERAKRYRSNHELTLAAMTRMGFKPFLNEENRGYIISTFHYPDDPKFDFQAFYSLLSEKGFVIYPGKLSKMDCFRIGHLGRIDHSDINGLMRAIAETLSEMKVVLENRKK